MANIALYDVNGECVRSLTQWDHDVSLKIRGVKTDPVPEVRCSNKNSTLASRVSATIIDDCVVFEVPNELLQEWHPINILLFYSYEAGDSKTEYRITIPVSPSTKPDGYAYTPSEVKTLDNLIARVEDLEKSGGGSAGSIFITDDGNGNIVIDSGDSVGVDDGDGNITLM